MKQWYESKTVWFNIIAAILGVLPVIGAYIKVISPDAATITDATIVFLAGIGNVILRIYFTDTPIQSGVNNDAKNGTGTPK